MDIKPIETYYNGYRFRSRLEARWAVFFDALGVEYEYEPEGFSLPSGAHYLPDFKVKCYGTRGERDGDPFDLWIEVKGKMSDYDANKIRNFSSPYTEEIRIGPLECTHYGECKVSLSPHSDYDDHCRRLECTCGYAIGKVDDKIESFSEFYCEITDTKRNIFCLGSTRNPVLIVGTIPNFKCSHDSSALKAYKKMDGCNIYPFNYELIDGDYFAAYPSAHNGRFYLWGDDSHYIWDDDIYAVENAYAKARHARFEHGETPTF